MNASIKPLIDWLISRCTIEWNELEWQCTQLLVGDSPTKSWVHLFILLVLAFISISFWRKWRCGLLLCIYITLLCVYGSDRVPVGCIHTFLLNVIQFLLCIYINSSWVQFTSRFRFIHIIASFYFYYQLYVFMHSCWILVWRKWRRAGRMHLYIYVEYYFISFMYLYSFFMNLH